ncbi:MAG TPA: cytochrome P450 [Steroidobacteraceae bacterium]
MANEIRDLPEIEMNRAFPTPGQPGFERFCKTLFGNTSMLARVGDTPVVFRNSDLRQFSALPQVGAPPPAYYDRTSFTVRDETGSTFAPSLSELVGNQFICANPPIHAPVRKVLAPHLMPKSVALLEPAASRIAAGIAAELSAEDEFDFCEHFAAKLAARFFGEFLDMTAEEKVAVANHIHELAPMFLRDKSAAELLAADRASRAFLDLVELAVGRLLSSDPPSVFHGMAAELAAIKLPSDPETDGFVPKNLGVLIASNMMDAFHTSGVAASISAFMLLMHPRYLDKVRADDALIRPAVHEALRLLSPLTVTLKIARQDLEFGGVRMPVNTPVVMLWAVGNRDPLAFEDPDRYIVERSHRFESTFGGGLHICPGRYVADMISQVALRELLRHSWRLAEGAVPPAFIDRSILSQLRSLRIRGDARVH